MVGSKDARAIDTHGIDVQPGGQSDAVEKLA
jgi:hypothetical protein